MQPSLCNWTLPLWFTALSMVWFMSSAMIVLNNGQLDDILSCVSLKRSTFESVVVSKVLHIVLNVFLIFHVFHISIQPTLRSDTTVGVLISKRHLVVLIYKVYVVVLTQTSTISSLQSIGIRNPVDGASAGVTDTKKTERIIQKVAVLVT